MLDDVVEWVDGDEVVEVDVGAELDAELVDETGEVCAAHDVTSDASVSPALVGSSISQMVPVWM